MSQTDGYDFFKVTSSAGKKDEIVVYPVFLNKKSKDIMIRGGKFYAIVDKNTGYWSQDEYKVQEIVDAELYSLKNSLSQTTSDKITVRTLESSKSHSWIEYKTYLNNLPDNFHQLDNVLCFDEDKVNQSDYISKKLPYKLERGSYDSWTQLVGTLYAPEERQKLEWAIGSIVTGDSKDIQKFIVLYGDPGAGKGTIIKIIQMLFPGYYEMFDAKSLSNSSNQFAFEQFRTNPLIALQTDGDLSRIEDNTKLNSLISHETIVMNEKRKQSYNFTPKCFLFMASNKPVDINSSKSGIKRRLIDVNPTNHTLPKKEYDRLMSQISYELGGIAYHCKEVYQQLGKNYYNGYKPYSMMEKTNPIYNFVCDYYEDLNKKEGIFIGEAFSLWERYCSETGMNNYMKRYVFKEELKYYFLKFEDFKKIGNESYRGWYTGIDEDKLKRGFRGQKDIPHEDSSLALILDQKESLLDKMLCDCQAQYAEEKAEGGSKPVVGWDQCKTTLKDIDTRKLHFVRVPLNHIVIDFDIKNEKGEKDALLNLEAADKWPPTYAEYSQGGKGIHLHYIYDGDPMELDSTYAKDIEVKVYSGKLSLRRRLSLCNNIPVATLSGGLPKKEKKDGLIDFESVKDEMHIRNIIAKCLKKDIAQPYTAPAVSLIKKTLDDAYNAGIKYDVNDMYQAISSFAAKSHHQKDVCMKMVNDMKFASKHYDEEHKWDGSAVRIEKTDEWPKGDAKQIMDTLNKKQPKDIPSVETRKIPVDETLVFFDIEVFPNLFLVNWKEAGEGKGVVRMINPTKSEINALMTKKLVGFNCRRYDNHILYYRAAGYSIEQLYKMSQRIISGSQNAMNGNAYDISYTDVYDFAAKKQSLKKWEIELGIHHQELGLPWDKPVPEERWAEVAAYCDNDVLATEAVFNHLAGDFRARQILAEIAGMSVNDTTNQLTTKIIFGDDAKPQTQFIYPDLAKEFPGYRFENGKSYYRHKIFCKKPESKWDSFVEKLYSQYEKEQIVELNDISGYAVVDEIIGEGGRVYANPGIYHNVTTFDVASMHPSSIIAENGFGKYTDGFKQLLDIRIAIKHKDFERAKQMLNGKLARYLDDPGQAKALSQALKIAINSVYGLTAAGFENKFRDPRNKDNWVAKRGALFIETLRLKVMEMGGTVVHIKTDSIKVQNPTKDISDFILEYGRKWGYNFEIEDIYEKICLVNDAVYIALRDRKDPSWLDECDKAKKKAAETGGTYVEPTRWTATGAQFQHPYVFKTLFSKEPVEFRDLCETKTVTSALYLDMNESLSDVSAYEADMEKLKSRVKKLLKTLGYSGSYSEWLDEEENGKLHGYTTEKILTAEEVEQIERELLDLNKDADVLNELIEKGHNYIFIGKAGSFCPVRAGCGGGVLCREKDGKFYSATGAKGYRWREGESLKNADRMDLIDMRYFEDLSKGAKETIEQFGNFEAFVSEEAAPQISLVIKSEDISKIAEEAAKAKGEPGVPPWLPPCGDPDIANCYDCPLFDLEKIPPECKKGYDLTRYFVLNPNATTK